MAVDVVLAVRTGVILGIPVAILVGFGAWILVDLFRAEVRTFLFGRRRSVPDVPSTTWNSATPRD